MHTKTLRFSVWAAFLLLMSTGAALLASGIPAGRIAHTGRDPVDACCAESDSIQAGRVAPSAAAEIRDLLAGQVVAWNRGDVDDFLAGYWNSEKTVFAGAQGVLHGWQALLERYRKNYPDQKAMGTLTFSELEVTVLCPEAALVIGHWHLEREVGPTGGVFSLVLRHFPEGWRIIADHTSTVPASTPRSP